MKTLPHSAYPLISGGYQDENVGIGIFLDMCTVGAGLAFIGAGYATGYALDQSIDYAFNSTNCALFQETLTAGATLGVVTLLHLA